MSRFFSLLVCILCLPSCYSKPTDKPAQVDHSQADNSQIVFQTPPTTTQARSNSDNLKVITPDWGIAAELAAMGHPPVATGDKRMYQDWMGQTLPPATRDLGIRYQPNPEMIEQMDIDLVLDNFFYEHIRTMYGDVPVKSILFNSETNKDTKDKRAIWQDYVAHTLELGEVIGQPKDAQEYVVNSDKALQELGATFRKKHPTIRKLAIVQFADVANLRMYVSNSVYQPTLDKMGLELVAFDVGNDWGFINIQLGDLDKLDRQQLTNHSQLGDIKHDSCLIVVRPFSDMLQDELKESALWQKMGFGQSEKNGRCMAVTEPVWMYGGIASMTSFANKLVRAELYGGGIKENKDLQQTSQGNRGSHPQGEQP